MADGYVFRAVTFYGIFGASLQLHRQQQMESATAVVARLPPLFLPKKRPRKERKTPKTKQEREKKQLKTLSMTSHSKSKERDFFLRD